MASCGESLLPKVGVPVSDDDGECMFGEPIEGLSRESFTWNEESNIIPPSKSSMIFVSPFGSGMLGFGDQRRRWTAKNGLWPEARSGTEFPPEMVQLNPTNHVSEGDACARCIHDSASGSQRLRSI